MRIVKYTARFKRDYRREESGRHGKQLDALLMEAVNLLAHARRQQVTISRDFFPGRGERSWPAAVRAGIRILFANVAKFLLRGQRGRIRVPLDR
jgi:hypothetical protein